MMLNKPKHMVAMINSNGSKPLWFLSSFLNSGKKRMVREVIPNEKKGKRNVAVVIRNMALPYAERSIGYMKIVLIPPMAVPINPAML